MMEGRRISAANPRPCSGRRILAAKKRGRSDGFLNSVKKLQRREISSKPDRSFSITNAQERFRNMRLMEEYDTHDPKGHCSVVLPFLMKRTKVIEIVAAQDIIFALAHSGVCAAFSRVTNHRICFLNASPDEVILSLFYNKNNDSVITVSVYASDNFSSLKCRSTRIEYIRRGNPDAGFALFESESLKWPGFVEFDDVNGKVLTYSAQDSIYKVFDLKNYTMLYSISDKDVQEIKISPGIMLLILNRSSSYVPLKILSIEDGTILKDFHHLLHRNKKVDFIEQFNEKLLVKQENENLQILDVRHTGIREVSRTEFLTPSAFIFLYENQLFLTFRNRTVAVWNFRGELVTSFEDHLLWRPDCNTNNTYITSDQDLIISYCKAESDDQWMEGNELDLISSRALIYSKEQILIIKACIDGTMLYQLKTTNTLLGRGTNNHEEFGTLVFLTPECKYFGLCGVHEDNVSGLPMPFDDVSAWTAFVERPISCWTFARLRSFGSCLNCDAVKRTPDWAIIKSHYLIPDSAGSINISNILTGKCLAKINATNGSPKDEECCSSTGSSKQSCSLMKSTVAEALEDITALFYDEDRNEIYTGNRHGLVHVWSN